MGVLVGHVKVQDNGAGVFRECDMKLIMTFRRQKDRRVVGDLVGLVIDDDLTGYILKEEKPAVVANAGFSLDSQGVLVYAGVSDMGIQIGQLHRKLLQISELLYFCLFMLYIIFCRFGIVNREKAVNLK